MIDLTEYNDDSDSDIEIDTKRKSVFINNNNNEIIVGFKSDKHKHNILVDIQREIYDFNKKKTSLYHQLRNLSNGLHGGFSGDITAPYIVGAICKILDIYIMGFLDLGCAGGRVILGSIPFFPFATYLGIDNNNDIIDMARKINTKITFINDDACKYLYVHYLNMNMNKILNDINIVYSFNTANIGLDVSIFLSIINKSVKYVMFTSIFQSLLLYDLDIYDDLEMIFSKYDYYYNLKLSGQSKKYRLKIFKIEDSLKEELNNKYIVKETKDAFLNKKGLYYMICKR